jgi:hypothetical protein
MKFFSPFSVAMLLLLFGVNSCLLKEAPKVKSKKLHVYFDVFVKEDKKWIKHFEKANKIKVIVHFAKWSDIKSELVDRPYDGKIDVLFVQTDSVKKLIKNLKTKTIELDDELFSDLPKQFANQHHLWLPICHNPLVLSVQKDSSKNCIPFNFSNWSRNNEGKKPLFNEDQLSDEQLYKLRKSKKTQFIFDKKASITYKQQLQPLSWQVEHAKNNCYYYLVEKRNYFTQTCWVVNPKYSRNQQHVKLFLKYVKKKCFEISKNRQQLPTFKQIPPNKQIIAINIH